MISLDDLKSTLEYNQETGVFIWKVSSRGHSKKGDFAGTKTGRYSYITICGKTYLAHRLAWLYFYGEWPINNIDHIDRNPRNNAIDNLRDVSQAINMQNMHADGASFDKQRGRWYAQITSFGKHKYLGTYATSDEARAAYQSAKKILHADSPLVESVGARLDMNVLGHADGRRRTNTSGFHGVSFKRQKNKYEAHIRVSGKYKFIGLFSTAQEASKARNAAMQGSK